MPAAAAPPKVLNLGPIEVKSIDEFAAGVATKIAVGLATAVPRIPAVQVRSVAQAADDFIARLAASPGPRRRA